MHVTVPCTCDAEEHELSIEVEAAFGKVGYYGEAAGDALPCGRVMTKRDVQTIHDAINATRYPEE